MANFGSFVPAFEGATAATDAYQRQEAERRQLASQQMFAQALQRMAQQQGGGANITPPTAMGSAMPAVPSSGGVSPPLMASAPAGPATGGAGPVAPMGGAGPTNPMSGGIDMQALVKALGSGIDSDPGAAAFAIQNYMKMMQPVANNAVKLDLGNLRANTQEDIADKNRSSREAIAAANNKYKLPSTQKPINDPEFRKLEQLFVGAQRAYTASPTEENYSNLQQASKAYSAYGGSAPANQTAPTLSTTAKPPVKITGDDDYNALPKGTQYVGPDGVTRVK